MSKNAKVWTALVTVYIIWGSTYLGIFYAGQTIPPLFAASTRFITAGTLLALFVTLVRRGSLRAPRREVLSCVLIGILLPGANSVLFFAEHRVGAALGDGAAARRRARALAVAGALGCRRRLRGRRGARAAFGWREG